MAVRATHSIAPLFVYFALIALIVLFADESEKCSSHETRADGTELADGCTRNSGTNATLGRSIGFHGNDTEPGAYGAIPVSSEPGIQTWTSHSSVASKTL